MLGLIVGPAEASLFAEISSAVRNAVPTVQVHEIQRLAEIGNAPPADLVLVFQQWPDEYTRAEVLTLINSNPLARLLVCYGPWCDSDGRTRDLWPLGTRVPVAAAPDRVTLELDQLRDAFPPLPLTSNRSDTYFPARTSRPRASGGRLSIAVVSSVRALSEELQDLLRASGHTIVKAPAQPADLLVWDADPWDAPAREELAALRMIRPNVPIAALCGFPRSHEVRELHAAGVATVVPKYVGINTLVERLQAAATTRPRISNETQCGFPAPTPN